MSIQIPDTPIQAEGFYSIPPEYEAALKEAQTLLAAQLDPAAEADWTDAGVNADVQLHRKDNPDDAHDIPWVKGVTTVEGATPEEVLATIQLPNMRKKWDPRFELGKPIQRYGPQSYLFYSVMKSPSYFIWARDIGGVQRNVYGSPSAGDITILQKSVDNQELLPDAGSYAKSRTRATVELSAWVLRAKGADTEVTYIVKIHLNGLIPTSVVSLISTETPMCVGRVRDTFYTTGFAPYDVHNTIGSERKTINATAEFEDGDGSVVTGGERVWTGFYLSKGEDAFTIRYDKKRMYPDGVQVVVQGDAKADVSAQVDGDELVKVDVKPGSEGKTFQVVITPK
ncbi:Bet v1-like protein [Tilletiaria anomala UBC 951]|uniref:Bet v1-like protein n=1 Tax=Tilletiaria anomala (strain ATCC 24038 / CBS 436.72 / UBC 951) TaxID=1037660 RepID=A0A066W8F6_TILAU|nr:Bet v1-like protein [Tilletiaria anomala UBC 951]KDN47329.1 Bet v1-like protein [Tilletiaria anomala UBC 951]